MAFPSDLNLRTTQIRRPATVDFGTSIQFDWLTNDFKLDSTGNPILISGIDNLIQWITKALSTARFRHPIYTKRFGSDIEDFQIHTVSRRGFRAIISELIREALLPDDRIRDVIEIKVVQENSDTLTVSFKVVTVIDREFSFSTDLLVV